MLSLDNENLTEIDKHIIRFKIISDSLGMLGDVTTTSGHKYAGTVCVRYGLIELRNFVKYYHLFIKIIDAKRKKLVLDLDPLLKEIFKYEKQIVKDRNNWVAHIKEKGDFIEEKPPEGDITLEDYLRMFIGVHRFFEGIGKIFFEEYDNLSRNLSKDEDEVFRKNDINEKLFQQENRHRVDLVNRKLALDKARFQLDKYW